MEGRRRRNRTEDGQRQRNRREGGRGRNRVEGKSGRNRMERKGDWGDRGGGRRKPGIRRGKATGFRQDIETHDDSTDDE